MAKTFWIFCLIVVLTACFRPHYRRQYVDIPNDWRIPTNEGTTLCNFSWWEQFGDPVLDDLIMTALVNNQDLQVAISRVAEYYASYRVVYANFFPFVNGQAEYTRTQYSLAQPTAFTATPALTPGLGRIFNNYEVFLNLNWEIDIWGQIQAATEAAYAQLLAQVEARRGVVMMVVSSVATTYIKLRALDLQLDISKKTLDSRYESLKLAQYRFELGETSELEVKQAESEVEIAAIQLLNYEKLIPQTENLLSILLGQNPHDILRGLSIDNFNYPLDIPAGIPSDLLARRPDIVQAEDNLVSANAQVLEVWTQFFPQFSLTGLFGSQSDMLKTFLTSPATMWQYGINATMPIFNAGQTMYQVDVARAQRDEALFTYRQVILNAFREVNDALIEVKMDNELVREHRKQVSVLQDYLHLAQLRYDEGEIDYLNVLDAERSLFNAQLDEVQSQADNFIAVVKLYNALGGGWVDQTDLIAINREDNNGYCDVEN